MQQIQRDYDVAIVGGGMVGMSLAIGCARLGLQVAVIDRDQLSSQLEAAYDGRVSAVARGSALILEHIGAWQEMVAYGEPILDIRVSDDHAPVFLHYDHREVGDEPFGHILENRHIRRVLHEVAAGCANLHLLETSSVSTCMTNTQHAVLTLAGQHSGELHARLLVAADGKHSQVRGMMGIDTTSWNYDQTAIVTTIDHEKPHYGLAQERFLPAGPFAVLPMQGQRSSLVWVEPQDRAPVYMALDDDEFIQEISERVGGYLGRITAVSHRHTYPLSLMHARRYTGDRFALAGDAAHGMHPIAGQGVNLGFRDVGVLLELIEQQHKLGLDIGGAALLAHYERWRAFDNVTMLAATDLINRLFSNNVIPLQAARRVGLWMVGQMPPVKRFFMRHAMGLTGDAPSSARRNS